MSFWKSPINGKEITGSERDSFTADFRIIPDETKVLANFKDAVISTYTQKNGKESDCYNITWKLTNGEFKNREVNQKIKAFDDDPKVQDRALNMLKRLFVLCALKPAHAGIPTESDFNVFKLKPFGVKIKQWSSERDGKIYEGNYVSEIHSPINFVCEEGKMQEPARTIDSSPSSAYKNKSSDLDVELGLEDIPF